MLAFVWLFLLLVVCPGEGSLATFLFPATFLNTETPCLSTEECRQHYNYSWCQAAGVVCIHRYCKLIPGYPCKSTHTCLEAEKRCLDKSCARDTDCDNGLYCDGREICQAGKCVVDPAQPNCLYSGGECDEAAKQCYEPKIRQTWRGDERHASLFTSSSSDGPTQAPTINTTSITQSTVNMTALIIISTVMGVIFLIAIIHVVSNSIRTYYRQRRY